MPRNRNGSGSDPRISQKLRDAIAALIEGRARTQGAAAQLAGMSGSQLSRALAKPHIQTFLLSQATRHLRGVPAALAVARLTQLVAARSEDVAARVSTAIAKSAGLIAPDGPMSNGAAIAPGPVLVVNFRHLQNPPEQITERTTLAVAVAPRVAEDATPSIELHCGEGE